MGITSLVPKSARRFALEVIHLSGSRKTRPFSTLFLSPLAGARVDLSEVARREAIPGTTLIRDGEHFEFGEDATGEAEQFSNRIGAHGAGEEVSLTVAAA